MPPIVSASAEIWRRTCGSCEGVVRGAWCVVRETRTNLAHAPRTTYHVPKCFSIVLMTPFTFNGLAM